MVFTVNQLTDNKNKTNFHLARHVEPLAAAVDFKSRKPPYNFISRAVAILLTAAYDSFRP